MHTHKSPSTCLIEGHLDNVPGDGTPSASLKNGIQHNVYRAKQNKQSQVSNRSKFALQSSLPFGTLLHVNHKSLFIIQGNRRNQHDQKQSQNHSQVETIQTDIVYKWPNQLHFLYEPRSFINIPNSMVHQPALKSIYTHCKYTSSIFLNKFVILYWILS